MTTKRLRPALAALVCSAWLGACGGGGDGADDTAPTDPAAVDLVPTSATVSATAYTQFAGSLRNSEQAQPLGLSGLVPPTSETDAPLALN